jgi:hypothetical protein
MDVASETTRQHLPFEIFGPVNMNPIIAARRRIVRFITSDRALGKPRGQNSFANGNGYGSSTRTPAYVAPLEEIKPEPPERLFA